VIPGDGATAPAYTMSNFTPSTVPGCRAPHLWLDDGRSLLDAMGPGYTLLRLDPLLDASALSAAAARAGVPFTLLDIDAQAGAAAGYDHKLVLCRPDSHIAWRGQVMPADPMGLIDRLRGAVPAASLITSSSRLWLRRCVIDAIHSAAPAGTSPAIVSDGPSAWLAPDTMSRC
jgi:hypothetical protein